jgi:hypothetical protein
VGPLSPLRAGRGSSSRGRGGQPGALKPELPGADGGDGVVREPTAPPHANQLGAPGRMLPPPTQDRLDEGLGGLGRGRPTPVIGGEQGVGIAVTEAVQQMPDGARHQTQGRGDGGTVLAILVAPPDGLAQGYGEGARHGPFSIGDSGRGTGPQCMPAPAQRQNFIARFHGTTSLRVTSPLLQTD